VVAFFAEILVHTKGRWARRAFELEGWQEHEVVRPVFGEVVWSPEWRCYVRRYRTAHIVVARKNGKSELAAGMVLYLLVGDDEEASEVYGAAKDTKQAGKVAEVVERMRQLSPMLNARLKFNKNNRRIYDEKTGSYYEVITSDAMGELGHNPHGFVLDEVLSQPDSSLWDALRTGAGTRSQPLFILCTTETSEPVSFGAQLIDEAERIEEDPARVPHAFSFVRKTPRDADPWDEANWGLANPALGSFLSLEILRQEALEAKLDPAKENAFRQYRLNQRVSAVTRWLPIFTYDSSAGMVDEAQLVGKVCVGGLDLSSVSDLTSLAWVFPDADRRLVVWRHFVPEAVVPELDDQTGGQFSQWVRQGFVRVTEGDVIDYDILHDQIAADAKRFAVAGVGIDPWNSAATANWLQQNMRKVQVHRVPQGYRLSPALKEIERLIRERLWVHGGNPVARWCFDAAEVRQDDQENIKVVKPDRKATGKRIDAVPSAANAVDALLRNPPKVRRAAVGF
jgi:phage terminase large subunit-like protein